MKAKITKIKNFKKNTHIQGFFLVREKHLRSTRTNHPYLQLYLQDNSGSIEAKVWENVPAFEKSFTEGDAVVVKGRISEYREQLQLEIEDIGNLLKDPGNFLRPLRGSYATATTGLPLMSIPDFAQNAAAAQLPANSTSQHGKTVTSLLPGPSFFSGSTEDISPAAAHGRPGCSEALN